MIEYEIVKSSETGFEVGLNNLKDVNRTLFYETLHDSSLIEIEFRPSKIEEINLVIMSNLKIVIKAWHKGMNNKKVLISRNESTELMVKAVQYKKPKFENVFFT